VNVGENGLGTGESIVLVQVSKKNTRAEMHPRHYSLEIVQHPIRARMCGFGDKVDPIPYALGPTI
jgi:hypothetical protein